MHEWLCAMGVSGAPGDQKRALDTPELELWIIVSYHVGTESLKLRSSLRATGAPN